MDLRIANANPLMRISKKRPRIRTHVGISLDGFIATPDGTPAWDAMPKFKPGSYGMMQLIGTTQLIVGVLLLSNRLVPLALALFAPFIVNSIAFHVFLAPSGLPMAAVFLALELYLAWAYRNAYRSMLMARTTRAPTGLHS